MHILIVGKGAVARELAQIIAVIHPDWFLDFFSSKDERKGFAIKAKNADAVCIAISTRDDGLAASSYIYESITIGKPVVTCEKGSLSEYFEVLKPHLGQIGYTTTVGGGSGILSILEKPLKVTRIIGVVNGTLNYIRWRLECGSVLEEAVDDARKLGLTDPGENVLTDMVNTELKDACRKLVILHNLAFPRCPIRQSDMSYVLFAKDEIEQLLGQGRLVVFIETTAQKRAILSGELAFWTKKGGHFLCGKFIKDVPDLHTLPSHADNCLLVEDNGRQTFAMGKGAGTKETAAAMLVDIRRLLNV